MPEHLGRRLVLALVLAVLGLAALQVTLSTAQTRSRTVMPPASDVPSPGAGLRSPQVLRELAGPGAWLIYLAAADRRLPDPVAPVIRVQADGRLVVDRPPPLAATPTQEWLAAGAVLPTPRLADLSPTQRVAVLDALGVLAGDRPVRTDQLVPWGIDASASERTRLLRWLRRP